MMINSDKSRICTTKTKAFPIDIKVGNDFLKVKDEMKIIGVILTPTFKCKKVFKKMWTLRRLKDLDNFSILD